MVKEYLDYLEKLNTLVDKDEILFKSASAIVMKDRKRMWDWTFWLSLVLAILSLGGTIVSMSAYYYHHQGTWVTPLVIGMVCVVSWVLATTAASKSIDYYNVLLDLEYASPIDSSYAIVRNAIVDEGDVVSGVLQNMNQNKMERVGGGDVPVFILTGKISKRE